MISAPQLSAPVINIRMELVVTPDWADVKNRRSVPALRRVSTAAPRHPSSLKNLHIKEKMKFNRDEIRSDYRLRT